MFGFTYKDKGEGANPLLCLYRYIVILNFKGMGVKNLCRRVLSSTGCMLWCGRQG